LTVLASGDARDVEALPIDADARLLGATLRAGDVIEHRLPPGRSAYLVTTAGRVTVNGVTLHARDGAGVADEDVIAIAALEDTEIVLAELLQN
jgi:redox-sensitive bicupin YhaK (pirin superfamily)